MVGWLPLKERMVVRLHPLQPNWWAPPTWGERRILTLSLIKWDRAKRTIFRLPEPLCIQRQWLESVSSTTKAPHQLNIAF